MKNKTRVNEHSGSRNSYASPSWGVRQVRRASGLIEDVCEHGVGHPNREWLAKHDADGKRAMGIHGCCGCCRCTCPTLDGVPVTGSSCLVHGLPRGDWD